LSAFRFLFFFRSSSLRAKRCNPGGASVLDCFVASLLAMTRRADRDASGPTAGYHLTTIGFALPFFPWRGAHSSGANKKRAARMPSLVIGARLLRASR
jgi:hypothetical protein